MLDHSDPNEIEQPSSLYQAKVFINNDLAKGWAKMVTDMTLMMDKRDKIGELLKKEGISGRTGLAGDLIVILLKNGSSPIDPKIMKKIQKISGEIGIKIVEMQAENT